MHNNKHRWLRHPGDRSFHVFDQELGGSVVTPCRGRWPVNAEDVEETASPPHEERCAYCQRHAIDPIERGLNELATHGVDDITARFDLSEEQR